MNAVPEPPMGQSRFQQLLGYLDHDPDNLDLLADAASAAVFPVR